MAVRRQLGVGLLVCFVVSLSAPRASAQAEGVPEAFARALERLDRMEQALDVLARSEDPKAASALDKVLRRLGDSITAYRDLDPGDRRLLATLRKKTIGKVSFNADTGAFREVCKLLQIVAGIPVQLSPEAQQTVRRERLVVVLETEDAVTIESFLNRITAMSDALTWRVSDGRVLIATREAEAAARPEVAGPRAETAADAAVLARLRGTNVAAQFATASLDDWTAYYAAVAKVSFQIDPALRQLPPDETALDGVKLPSTSVDRSLDAIAGLLGLAWRIENAAVVLERSRPASRARPR